MDKIPPWMTKIYIRAMAKAWERSRLPLNRNDPVSRSIVEEFKYRLICDLGNQLDDVLIINEPVPTPEPVQLRPNKPTQPVLYKALPTTAWNPSRYIGDLYKLKGLGKMIFLDLETTGLNIQTDRIIQISMIMINHAPKCPF